jgi:Na+-transporting methylmalonyl-CoA/oxaloacetate decarboxylase beta subunit
VQVGFGNLDLPHLIMICIGLGFVALAIIKKWKPYELLPIEALTDFSPPIANPRAFLLGTRTM